MTFRIFIFVILVKPRAADGWSGVSLDSCYYLSLVTATLWVGFSASVHSQSKNLNSLFVQIKFHWTETQKWQRLKTRWCCLVVCCSCVRRHSSDVARRGDVIPHMKQQPLHHSAYSTGGGRRVVLKTRMTSCWESRANWADRLSQQTGLEPLFHVLRCLDWIWCSGVKHSQKHKGRSEILFHFELGWGNTPEAGLSSALLRTEWDSWQRWVSLEKSVVGH